MTRSQFAEHEFRKAAISNPNLDCVAVARRDGWVEIRDDKTVFGAPDDHRLLLTEPQFDAFQTSIRSGDPHTPFLQLTSANQLRSTLPQPAGPNHLTFTAAEIAAFRHGITHGDFTPHNP